MNSCLRSACYLYIAQGSCNTGALDLACLHYRVTVRHMLHNSPPDFEALGQFNLNLGMSIRQHASECISGGWHVIKNMRGFKVESWHVQLFTHLGLSMYWIHVREKAREGLMASCQKNLEDFCFSNFSKHTLQRTILNYYIQYIALTNK